MAIAEIEVRSKIPLPDPRLSRQWQDAGLSGQPDITSAVLYRFENITDEDARRLAAGALTDPVTQNYEIAPAVMLNRVEIGYKPGVMNPVEESLQTVCRTLGIKADAVGQSRIIYVHGDVSFDHIAKFAASLPSQVEQVVDAKPETLLMSGQPGPVETVAVTGLSGHELQELSDRRRLFLNESEMSVIARHFRELGREPSDVELETLAQTWSEHNGHKTFKARLVTPDGLIKEPLITRIKRTSAKYYDQVGVVTAFADNAGGIRFYDGQVILIKGETHNSPVAVEPYGGALTKNGGVYRDIAGCGLGGQNLFGIMVNCMGDPRQDPSTVPSGSLHPRTLLLENSRGERDYGNRMGIPTHAVSLHFHRDFGPKPTSMGIVVGLVEEKYSQKRNPVPGDLLFTVGGRTGRDGIHGATFSSAEMTAVTHAVDATAVQIGNAIEEKRMFDALQICRNRGLISAITDCGGGGFSSAIGEMGETVGVTVYLSAVPTKYSGLSPWEIWLSESQERMAVAVTPGKAAEFSKVLARYDVSASEIGCFTGDRRLKLIHGGAMVANLPMDFLHDGLPQREMKLEYIPYPVDDSVPEVPVDWIGVLENVLSHGNIASVEPMLRQYDNTVQGTTVMGPYCGVNQNVPTEASVVAPLPGKPYGVVTAHALHPILNRLDPYQGTKWTIAHALARLTAAGGNYHESALIDNFVWPKPDTKFMGDLDRSVDGLCESMDVIGVPCISGKDSLSSSFRHPDGRMTHIPPVLNITAIGRIPDVVRTITPDIKQIGSTLVLVGNPDWQNLGGSVYFDTCGLVNSHPPEVDLEGLPELYDRVGGAIGSGAVLSAATVGEGGLAATVTKMCIGGACGADLDLAELGETRADFAMFAETAGCFVVEVADSETAGKLFHGLPYRLIGETRQDPAITVTADGRELFTADTKCLTTAWQRPMKEILGI